MTDVRVGAMEYMFSTYGSARSRDKVSCSVIIVLDLGNRGKWEDKEVVVVAQ